MHVNPLAIQEDLAVEKRTPSALRRGFAQRGDQALLESSPDPDANVWGQPYS